MVHLDALTDEVTKVTEAPRKPFWHFWHCLTLGCCSENTLGCGSGPCGSEAATSGVELVRA